MKGLSFHKTALRFFKSKAKCVTFPSIKILLSIAMVMPMLAVTVCNRLHSSSLSKLMIMAIESHHLMKLTCDAVLLLWKSVKPRIP